MVEDAKLLKHLRESLGRQIIDVELMTNDLKELSGGGDQIGVESAVRVVTSHQININRQGLSGPSLGL